MTTTTSSSQTSSPPIPSYVKNVDEMISAGVGFIASLSNDSIATTKGQMEASLAAVQEQIANLDNVNEQMQQVMEQQQKEARWGWVGEAFTAVLSICLMPVDPTLSMSLMAGNTMSISGLTQDVVGWISEGLQDIFPDLNDQWAKAISDLILVASVVLAAVVIGVVTAGAGDVVIAEAVAEDAAENVAVDIAGDVGSELMDMAGGAIEGASEDVVGTTATDVGSKAAEGAASSASDGKAGNSLSKNRAKRGAKFATMLGSQMMMQTQLMPNVVLALASTSSNPDSAAWKWATVGAFAAETLLCFGGMIGACFIEAPSFIDDAAKGSSSYAKIRKAGRTAALFAGMGEATSDTVAGAYGLAAAANTNQLKDEASDQILLNALSEMSEKWGEAMQKGFTDLEESIFKGQDLAGMLSGYQIEA